MARRCLIALLPGVLLLPSSSALAKTPWEQLMGRKPKIWHDPKGRFSLDLPVGWEAFPDASESAVRFVRPHPDTGLAAEVQVEMRALPPGVKAVHFDARVQAQNRERAPGYVVRDRVKTTVSGVPAVQTLFTYRARGNAELAREVVQTVLVAGERGFVITLETIEGTRRVFWEEFELMVEGFSAGRGGARASSDRTREKRRRIRAGEMINPDAVGY
jgi:hypothetical protein